VDLVLIMSVNPGFGGQKFIPETLQKVAALHAIKQQLGLDFIIEVDGGVNIENAPLLQQAGANALVAGSFVFNSTDPKETIKQLNEV
jgi:ribulose-phosphate 3-epimerase